MSIKSKVFYLTIVAMGSLSFIFSLSAEECSANGSISVSSYASEAIDTCCTRKNSRAQDKCFKRSTRAMRRMRNLLSADFTRETNRAINTFRRQNSCGTVNQTELTCTASSSLTLDELKTALEGSACVENTRTARQRALKQARSTLSNARRFLNLDFLKAMRSQIRSLLRSRECGRGGVQTLSQCGRIVDPRDGFKIGNVYKLGDYTGKPVFITHNGARRGTAITTDGELISRLDYTGEANPDGDGDRHHYRVVNSCRSLPDTYYLNIGDTCYEIDDKCGRID